jgi:D-alanyl-D-alanine carboxypeptidase (penicillin-binding protein 5/6)
MRSSKRRKNRSGKSRKLLFSSLIVLIVIAGYIATFLLLPLRPIYATKLNDPVSSSGTLNVTWPASEQAAIGVLGSGALVSNGAQTPQPTASIAKLVTALTVLKKYPLSLGQQGPTITITASDVDDYNNFVAEDGSVVKVVAGEQITEYQALEAMLLPSANNMADTLAIWAYGSTANYLVQANIFVRSLSMNSTTISDASGFLPTTVSNSLDLIKLGEASLNNPVISQIVDLPSATLPVAGLVQNVDWYVGTNNLIGIKTGNTDQAGGTFLSAAKYNLGDNQSITVIGAVMKAATLQQALNGTLPMLQSVKNQIKLQTLASATPVSSFHIPWGGVAESITNTAIAIPYLPQMPVSYTNISSKVTAPVAPGKTVGLVTLGVGNDKVTSATVLNSAIPKPSKIWRLSHPQYFF